jgi:hypothetical protein
MGILKNGVLSRDQVYKAKIRTIEKIVCGMICFERLFLREFTSFPLVCRGF